MTCIHCDRVFTPPSPTSPNLCPECLADYNESLQTMLDALEF